MGSQVCIFDLAENLSKVGYEAVLNDWDNYAQYDVAVFMGIEPEIEKARQQNPNIKIVIGDPKQSSQTYIDTARAGDLLLVSSIEQREAFQRLNSNILIFPMFPIMPEQLKKHSTKDEIVIGYHGNKVHLEAMGHHVAPALEAIAKDVKIKLVLVYNLDKLGECKKGLPNPDIVKTQHIQWHENIYDEVMPNIDVGIVPNLLPVRDFQKTLISSEEPGLNVNYEPFDFMTRYKASSNPGRVAVFGKYGIPVVTDFTPSACQMITDGADSYLAGTPHGWYWALKQLIQSAGKRQKMGHALAANVQEMQNSSFNEFIRALDHLSTDAPIALKGVSQPEEDLEYYKAPPQPSLLDRALRRAKSTFMK